MIHKVPIQQQQWRNCDLDLLCTVRGPDLYMDWDKMEGQPYAYFTYGVCCSEVELDSLTGDYRVRASVVTLTFSF